MRIQPYLTFTRVLIATIWQLGGCLCSQCPIPKTRLHHLGMVRDRQQRATLVRSDTSRSPLVATARSLIYEKHYGIDSVAVETILKADSWVPTSVRTSISLFLTFTNPSSECILGLSRSLRIQRLYCTCC